MKSKNKHANFIHIHECIFVNRFRVGSVEMSADDTVIYISNTDPKECIADTQQCLDLFSKWCWFS